MNMLTAFKDGTRKLTFASKGILGWCPECSEALITKCGKIITPHFAHKSYSDCGKKYHDGMSEWHYNWQLKINKPIPGINIEVPIKQEYLKRADVVTKEGVIIEFQKSPLPIDERKLREYQYKNMIWVVHKDIEKSKTWSYHKSMVPILIDDPQCDYLYPREKENFRISKRCFINMMMNGNVAYPDIFLNEIFKIQQYRKKMRRFNSLLDYDIDFDYHFIFREYNNSKSMSWCMFDYFNKEIENLTKPVLFTNF